jgi:hypothetical protein
MTSSTRSSEVPKLAQRWELYRRITSQMNCYLTRVGDCVVALAQGDAPVVCCTLPGRSGYRGPQALHHALASSGVSARGHKLQKNTLYIRQGSKICFKCYPKYTTGAHTIHMVYGTDGLRWERTHIYCRRILSIPYIQYTYAVASDTIDALRLMGAICVGAQQRCPATAVTGYGPQHGVASLTAVCQG